MPVEVEATDDVVVVVVGVPDVDVPVVVVAVVADPPPPDPSSSPHAASPKATAASITKRFLFGRIPGSLLNRPVLTGHR
jgi:hypothetical protein